MSQIMKRDRLLWTGAGPRPISVAGRRSARRDGHRYQPGLMVLEDRRLLSTFVVTSTADDGSDGTLRWAVAQANSATSPSFIDIEVSITATIPLTQGPLVLTNTAEPTTIYGETSTSTPATLSVSGNNASRVLQIDDGVTATIDFLGFEDGSTSGNGGGIYNAGTLDLNLCTISGNTGFAGGGMYNKGTATLYACTIRGNSGAGSGGGVFNQGTMNLNNVVFSGNTATGGKGGTGGGFPFYSGGSGSGNGGALFNHGTLNLTLCTITGNTAAGGGGLFNYGPATLLACTISGNTGIEGGAGGIFDYSYASTSGSVTMTDTIVAGNFGSGGAINDMFIEGTNTNNGGGITGSYNLVGDILKNGVDGNISGVTDPLLAPLASYGDEDPGMPVLPGSPAIDAGIPISGVSRDPQNTPFGPTPDIGAFESNGFTLTPVAGSTPQGAAAGDPFAKPLAVTVTANNPVEPVAGGVITFTPPPTTGPTAVLSAPTAVIGSDGVAQVTATANTLTGPYTVTASAAGAAGPVDFDLDNLIVLNFSGISNQSIPYGTPIVTFSGTLGGGSQYPQGAGEYVGVSLGGIVQQAPFGPGGTFSATFNITTADLTVGLSPYTIQYVFSGDDTYAPASTISSLTVTQATPTVAAVDPGGTYNQNAFPATATVTGIGGTAGTTLENKKLSLTYYSGTYTSLVQLDGLTPLSAAPSDVGAYTVLASFPGSSDYTAATALGNFAITPATPTVTVADAGGPYTNTSYPATDTVAGLGGSPGPSLEGVGLSLAYYSGTYTKTTELSGLTPLSAAPSSAGAYTALASFPGSPDYATAARLVNFTIAQATPTLTVADPGGTYSGPGFPATDTVAGIDGALASSLEGVVPLLTYYGGTYTSTAQLAGVEPLPDAPSDAGAFTVEASFPGSTDYTAAAALANFTIAQVTPIVTVAGTTGTYTGSAFSAAANVTGISGPAAPSLEGVTPSLAYYSGTYTDTAQLINLNPLPAAPSDAGSYTVLASFPGSTDYVPASGLASFTITPATPTVSVTGASGAYTGSAFTATATVTGVLGPAASNLEGVPPSLSYYSGTYTETAQLDGLTPLATAPSQLGSYTVLASFPGSTDYTTASNLSNFTITQAALSVTWSPPAPIVFGTPLSSTQLDAVASVPGTFTYTPAIGAILDASSGQVLSVTFTPQDTTDYTTAATTTTIDVDKATPTLNLADPGGRFDGSPFPASLTIAGSGSENVPAASLQNITPTLTYFNSAGPSMGPAPPSAAGSYTVVAVFPGTTNYAAVQSAVVPFTIAQGNATVTLAASGSSAVYGQPVTFVATVAAVVAGTPGGTVTFSDGGTVLATVPLNGAGTATVATSNFVLGSYAIAATYSGDADFLGAQSGPAAESVAQARTAIVLVPHPVLKKKRLKAVGLTAEIEPVAPGGGVPTGGTATFEFLKKHRKKVKVKVLGTAAVSNGDATLTLKPNKVVRKPLTIVYSGDTDYLASTLTPPKLTKRALKRLAKSLIDL